MYRSVARIFLASSLILAASWLLVSEKAYHIEPHSFSYGIVRVLFS
jgi:hypothetical protein